MTREVATDDDGLIRLQKLLAQSGVASRRRCEELMLAGEVEVDGEVVTRLGTKVDPRTAVIRVSGKRLPPVSDHVYLVLNKPRGVVSTMSDPEGRPTIADLVADRPERLFHVGRLDTDTTGCCCSPTTATSRTGWRTRRTRSTRPTWPRSTARSTSAP